jgi:hypothetical protein
MELFFAFAFAAAFAAHQFYGARGAACEAAQETMTATDAFFAQRAADQAAAGSYT